MDLIDKFIDKYEKVKPELTSFTTKIEALVTELLAGKGIVVHSINGRLKANDSLEKKLVNSDFKYEDIEDVTDLCGIRIITYFEDDVDKVAKVIKEEFDIDVNNSIDKRQVMDPDRFGYLSLHYICSLSKKRVRLAEYKKYDGFKTEIQIRSILQHAWAEMEHDLGYKSEVMVPRNIKRRFSRLASLLELADNEFLNIREDLDRYSKKVIRMIEEKPEQLLIDKVTLSILIKTNIHVADINKEIAKHTKSEIRQFDSMDKLVNELNFIGVQNIKELIDIIESEKSNIIQFANSVLHRHVWRKLSAGIGLFYVCYYELAKRGNIEEIKAFLDLLNPGSGPRSGKFAQMLLNKYKEVMNNK